MQRRERQRGGRHSASRTHPNSEVDRYLSLLDDGAQPRVILLHRDGRPQAALFCQRQTIALECKIGYLNLLKPSLKGLSVIYRGFLGQETPEVCRRLMDELSRMLHDGECDVVELIHFPTDSELYRAARTMPGILRRGHFPKVGFHWRMPIPRHIDLYYESLSKKHRYNLKRSSRMLEDRHRVRVVEYRSEDDLEEVIRLAATIAPKTYQYALTLGLASLLRTVGLEQQIKKGLRNLLQPT